jgi:pantoate--beta-alanine ligase
MYPDGDPVVRVSAGRIGEVLEGAFRPGHLDGVLTVVLKLAHLARADAALFGQKDAQQLAAVRAMVRDLDLPVTVIGMPIVREADGLALSSRNAYLTPDERRRALSLSHALAAARAAAGEGSAPDDIRAAALEVLTGAEGVDSVDYAALVDPDSFEDVAPAATGPALLALAAHVGATRLIDNVGLTLR